MGIKNKLSFLPALRSQNAGLQNRAPRVRLRHQSSPQTHNKNRLSFHLTEYATCSLTWALQCSKEQQLYWLYDAIQNPSFQSVCVCLHLSHIPYPLRHLIHAQQSKSSNHLWTPERVILMFINTYKPSMTFRRGSAN